MEKVGTTLNERYKILELIGEGNTSSVWLADDLSGNDKVIIKFLKKSVVSNRIEDIIRFKNDINTLSELNIPGIIPIFEVGRWEDSYFLVTEYIKGKKLYDLLDEKFRLSVEDACTIISEVGRILQKAHDHNMFHRDLKPKNIYVNFENGQKGKISSINVNNFGFAHIKEFNIKNIGDVSEALVYMSPEQNRINILPEKHGVLKRNIDERSDLYSMGVILYQMLSGELPFKNDNMNSIIYKQVSVAPVIITEINPDVPPILGEIVLKLINKEPEKRYQSIGGLLQDLDRFINGQSEFDLGMNDKAIKLSYSTPLAGRDEELERIKSAFDGVLLGKGSVILVGGDAGIGKSRLIDELRSYVYEKNGLVISGKCFSGKGKNPYGPFKDALDAYVKYFNAKYKEKKRKDMQQKLINGIGNLSGVILKLNPAMEEVIGKCQSLIKLEPERENRRFVSVVTQFFLNMGKAENGLVVMINDLQWGDEGSFDLINEIVRDIADYPVLIIATYRDQELGKDHGITHFVKNSMNNKYPLTGIQLKPFNIKSMNRFISGILFDTEENAIEISEFILHKSKGNPLFAIEILKLMVNENAIFHSGHKWNINKEIFSKIEISANIIDILIKKLSILNKNEIFTLSYASIIGKKFDYELLFELVDLSQEEIVKIVDKAMNLQLLEEDLRERGKIYFTHDRIKEAFYKNISKEKKQELHLKTAKILERIHKENIPKIVFELVHHYIEGEDKEKMLEYAYPAGLKAYENYANDEAIKLLKLEIELLEENGDQGSECWIRCMEIVGEIYLTLGKNTEAIELFNKLLSYLRDNLRKIRTYKQISYACFRMGDFKKSEEYGKQGLKILGETLPVERSEVIFTIFKERFIKFIYGILPSFVIKDVKNTVSEEVKQAIWIYYILSWSYSQEGNLKVASTAIKMLNYAERRVGKSKELALSLMVYAVFLAEIPKYKTAYKYHKKSLDMRREINDEWGIAQSLKSMGFYYKCKGEYRKSTNCFKESININKKIGDIGELEGSTSGLAVDYMNLAEYYNAKTMNDQYFEMSKQSNDSFQMALSWMYTSMYYMEIGDCSNAEYYGNKSLKVAFEMNKPYMSCMAYAMIGRIEYEKGDIDKSIECLENAKNSFEKNHFLKELTTPLFPFLAEAYIAKYLLTKVDMSKEDERLYLERINKTCKEALNQTKLWPTYHMCSLRAYAKYYVLKRNRVKAEKLFLKCIKLSRELERKYELAIGLYEYGKYLRSIDKKSEGKMNLERAFIVFKEIGSSLYLKRVSEILNFKE